jgi:hypothetical protein
LVVSEQVVVT